MLSKLTFYSEIDMAVLRRCQGRNLRQICPKKGKVLRINDVWDIFFLLQVILRQAICKLEFHLCLGWLFVISILVINGNLQIVKVLNVSYCVFEKDKWMIKIALEKLEKVRNSLNFSFSIHHQTISCIICINIMCICLSKESVLQREWPESGQK